MSQETPFPATRREQMYYNVLIRKGDDMLSSVWALETFALKKIIPEDPFHPDVLERVALAERLGEYLEENFSTSRSFDVVSQDLLMLRRTLLAQFYFTIGTLHMWHPTHPVLDELSIYMQEWSTLKDQLPSLSAVSPNDVDQWIHRVLLDDMQLAEALRAAYGQAKNQPALSGREMLFAIREQELQHRAGDSLQLPLGQDSFNVLLPAERKLPPISQGRGFWVKLVRQFPWLISLMKKNFLK